MINMDSLEQENIVDTSTSISRCTTPSISTTTSLKCANISRNLAKCVGLPTPIISRSNSADAWKPPDNHGLQNSDPIIPAYYLTGKDLKGNMLFIDYFFTIQDNIKNYRPLTAYQKQYLTTLSSEQLMSLVLLYNEVCTTTLQNILMEN